MAIPAIVATTTIVSQVFGAIASLARSIGIKAKTAHFSDVEAEGIAKATVEQFVPYLRQVYTPAQLKLVVPFMIDKYNQLRTSWWPGSYQAPDGRYIAQRPDRHDIVVQNVQRGFTEGSDAAIAIQTILFQVFYWVWRNVDRDKPDANLKIVAEGIYPVIVIAAFDKAGLNSAPLLYTGGTVSEGGTPKPPITPTPAPATQTGLASLGSPLLIIALVGAAVYFIGRKAA